MPRVQLIRGLARTIEKADLSADDQKTLQPVSSTVGRYSGVELIQVALIQVALNVASGRSEHHHLVEHPFQAAAIFPPRALGQGSVAAGQHDGTQQHRLHARGEHGVARVASSTS